MGCCLSDTTNKYVDLTKLEDQVMSPEALHKLLDPAMLEDEGIDKTEATEAVDKMRNLFNFLDKYFDQVDHIIPDEIFKQKIRKNFTNQIVKMLFLKPTRNLFSKAAQVKPIKDS